MMAQLIGDAVTASSTLVSTIVCSVMETTNQLMSVSRRRLEEVLSEETGSDADDCSSDNSFLILTEDHFAEELAAADDDEALDASTGVRLSHTPSVSHSCPFTSCACRACDQTPSFSLSLSDADS